MFTTFTSIRSRVSDVDTLLLLKGSVVDSSCIDTLSEQATMSISVSPPLNGEWSGDAMVLRKLPVPRHPANLNHSRTMASALAVGAGGGRLDIFFLSSVISSFSMSLGDDPI